MSFNNIEELKPIVCPISDSHSMHIFLVRYLQGIVSKKVQVHFEDNLVVTEHLIRCQISMHRPPRTIAQFMAKDHRSQRGWNNLPKSPKILSIHLRAYPPIWVIQSPQAFTVGIFSHFWDILLLATQTGCVFLSFDSAVFLQYLIIITQTSTVVMDSEGTHVYRDLQHLTDEGRCRSGLPQILLLTHLVAEEGSVLRSDHKIDNSRNSSLTRFKMEGPMPLLWYG